MTEAESQLRRALQEHCRFFEPNGVSYDAIEWEFAATPRLIRSLLEELDMLRAKVAITAKESHAD